jgi:hypothetical protein
VTNPPGTTAQGAVIFVCAPHANQFLDPLVVTHNVGRPVGFLAAKASVDRKYIGKIMKVRFARPPARLAAHAPARPARPPPRLGCKGHARTHIGTRNTHSPAAQAINSIPVKRPQVVSSRLASLHARNSSRACALGRITARWSRAP